MRGNVFLLLAGLVKLVLASKKGIVISPNNYFCDDLSQFDEDIWYYDYRPYRSYMDDDGCTVPGHPRAAMFWGWKTGRDYSDLIAADAEYVMGFNEPNHVGQANLTPAEAVEGWHEIERVAGGRLLVTPSASRCTSASKCLNDTTDWFDEFFRLCDNCTFDYLATHHYSSRASSTMSYLEELYERYGLPIWLTEFCTARTSDEDVLLEYMSGILPQLEEADYVDKYFWYVSRKPTNGYTYTNISLLEQGTSTLTTLGEYYNDYDPTEKYVQLLKYLLGLWKHK